MEMAEKQQKLNAMFQQQSVMAAAQAKQKELSFMAQNEQMMLTTKAEVDSKILEIEYALKNKFEEAQHERRIDELKLQAESRVGGEVEKEDRKDERNEKSDYNQSQMIEQRKDRRKPLDSPEEISLLPNV